MKVQIVLPLTIVLSVALMGVISVLRKELLKEEKRSRFQGVKLRVSGDVLSEFLNDRAEVENQLRRAEGALETLEKALAAAKSNTEKNKPKADACEGEQKSETDQVAATETELNNLKAELEKESNGWKTEEAALQQQHQERSQVCNFLKEETDITRGICGSVAVQPEQPKAEAPKPEEPKAEAPKPEEPKAEAPKPEEPKAEAPKPEEPKAEAPKPEEPKAEAPKPEEPKAEAPKPEEPKAEAPKPEEPKAEAPK